MIAWAHEKGDDGTAAMWQVHYDEIERQGREWLELGEEFGDTPLIVAGDFNQDRDGSGRYGTRRGRDLLKDALDRAELVCLSDEDVVASGKLADSHLVDHIAASRGWASQVSWVLSCREKTDPDGVRLSDHPTVVADLGRQRDIYRLRVPRHA